MIKDNITSIIGDLTIKKEKITKDHEKLIEERHKLSTTINLLEDLLKIDPNYLEKIFIDIFDENLLNNYITNDFSLIRDLLNDIEYALGNEHPYNPKYDANVVANEPNPHHNLAYTLDLLMNFVNDRI